MNIKFVERKVNLRDNFKELTEKKLAKFNRIFDEDANAIVVVTVARNRQTVEITISQRDMICRAEATSEEMNEALDMVVSKLSSQIRKNKTKLERTKKVKNFDLSQETSDINTETEETEYEIKRVKKFFVKTMSVEEAILQMNMLEHVFFMFRNDQNDEINVVYVRKDGSYGLLEPTD
jgi:putative sigma-54 modulation protein